MSSASGGESRFAVVFEVDYFEPGDPDFSLKILVWPGACFSTHAMPAKGVRKIADIDR